MAAEFEAFVHDLLARLPDDHPDRPFLHGMYQAAAAYSERADALAPKPPAELIATEATETAAAAGEPETAERERVRLRGRVGARPRFRTTPRGVRVGVFPLGVREDPDAEDTTWYRVHAFNKPSRPLADRLEQLGLSTGQTTDVIGYPHVVETRALDGTTRRRVDIYAAAIRTR